MFKTLRNAFKVKDIRDRILFTFLMLIIIRIGSELPAPGVDGEVFKQWWASQSADGLGFFNAITGGSFLNMSVFALNITPYITSSIIIQLLTIAIPKLEEIQRDGEEGRKKMVALTRYVTIVLALIQSIAMTIGFYRGGYLTGQGPLAVIEVITGLTAGSAVLMWIGERITEKGIGNGISIVLVINIISRMPEDMGTLWSQFIANKSIPKGIVAGLIIIAIIVAMVVFVVVLQDAEQTSDHGLLDGGSCLRRRICLLPWTAERSGKSNKGHDDFFAYHHDHSGGQQLFYGWCKRRPCLLSDPGL